MARRPRLFAPGVLYHVIARGNHQQPTFLNDRDYEAYLERVARYRERYGVTLYAYCLMPNHIHLLLQTSDAPLAKFMQGLQQSYTQRFNRVHGAVGHLFQGRYRAIICETDEYLITLVRYIHLNPVRAGLVDHPELYVYSGHRVYLNGDGTELIDPGPVLRMLGGRAAYQRFVLGGIGAGHEERYYRVEDQPFLGTRCFAQEIRHRAAQPSGPSPRKPLDVALEQLARQIQLDLETLKGPDRSHSLSMARAFVSFVLVRRLGYRVVDVAALLGRDVATVSVIVSRFANRMKSQGCLAEDLARVRWNV
jgi:putative transposase